LARSRNEHGWSRLHHRTFLHALLEAAVILTASEYHVYDIVVYIVLIMLAVIGVTA
jgi:hypothetical protein